MSETTPKDAAPEAFNRQKALDDVTFLRFLKEVPDNEAIDFNDGEALKSWHEKYKLFNTVREGVGKMYAEHVSKEIGVKIDAEGKGAIEAYLMRAVIEHPEQLEELRASFTEFTKTNDEIRGFDKRIAAIDEKGLLVQRGGHEEDLNNLNILKRAGGLGRFFPTTEVQAARNALTEKYKLASLKKADREGIASHAVRGLENVENTLDVLATLKQARGLTDEGLGGIRKEIVGSMLKDEVVATAIGRLVTAQLEKMVDGKGVASLKDAEAYLDKIVEIANESGVANEFANPEELRNMFEQKVKQRAQTEIGRVIASERVANGLYTRLHKNLAMFLEYAKRSNENKEFVRSVLNDQLGVLGENNQEKRFVVSQVIADLDSDDQEA